MHMCIQPVQVHFRDAWPCVMAARPMQQSFAILDLYAVSFCDCYQAKLGMQFTIT